MDIGPRFGTPVPAPSLDAVQVSFASTDQADDFDEEGDLPGLTLKQKILIGALVIGGIAFSRGRLHPSTAWKIVKYGGGSLFGTGALGLATHGGHGPDSAAVPLKPKPLPKGTQPEVPGQPLPPGTLPPALDTILSAASAVQIETYKAAIRGRILAHLSDGSALEFIALIRRVLNPRRFPTAPKPDKIGGAIEQLTAVDTLFALNPPDP